MVNKITTAYDAQYWQIVEAVRARAISAWGATDIFNETQRKEFINYVASLVQAGQIQAADLTGAYFAQLATQYGLPEVDVERFQPVSIRRIPANEVYARPTSQVFWELSKGAAVGMALKMGETRLEQLLGTDMQLAKTHSARHYGTSHGFKHYLRVTHDYGEGSCALCMIASTQHYRMSDLLPIHPGCNCTVEPEPPRTPHDMAADGSFRVVDDELLASIHQAVTDAGFTASASGRDIDDYRHLLMVRTHGEYGPTLTFRKHLFTGSDDLPV